MKRPKTPARRVWRVLARSGLILPGLFFSGNALHAGDWWWNIDPCATIPKGAITPSYGTHVNRMIAGQHARAEFEKFVIYKHEWYLGGTAPGPAGRRHLNDIAQKLACAPGPVVIEVIEPEEREVDSPEAAFKLNEERRRKVVEYLAARGDIHADQRVILGYPTAEGLYGLPSQIIGIRYIYSQAGFGGAGGGGGGGVGGLGGGMGGGGMGGGGMGGGGMGGGMGGMGAGGFF